MSRNSKIRYMADQLPPFPKLDGRKVQYDANGNIIYVNHFRELKRIQEKMKDQGYGHEHPQTAKAWASYAARVLAYDKRSKRKSRIQKATIYTILVLIAIAIAEFQRKIGIKLF